MKLGNLLNLLYVSGNFTKSTTLSQFDTTGSERFFFRSCVGNEVTVCGFSFEILFELKLDDVVLVFKGFFTKA